MKLRFLAAFVIAALVAGCSQMGFFPSQDVSDAQLESFFRHHTVNGHPAVALKKQSMGAVSYLLTIHGYPDSLQVCQRMIKGYNEDPSLSVVPGHYYCEVLQ